MSVKRKREQQNSWAVEFGIEEKCFSTWKTYCTRDLCEKNGDGELNFEEWLNATGGKNRAKVVEWFRLIRRELNVWNDPEYQGMRTMMSPLNDVSYLEILSIQQKRVNRWMSELINFSVSNPTGFLTIGSQYAMHQRYRELKSLMDDLNVGQVLKIMTYKPLSGNKRLFTILHYEVKEVIFKANLPDSYVWYQRDQSTQNKCPSLYVLEMMRKSNIQLPSNDNWPTITPNLEMKIKYRKIVGVQELRNQCQSCTLAVPLTMPPAEFLAQQYVKYTNGLKAPGGHQFILEEYTPWRLVLNPYMCIEDGYHMSMHEYQKMIPNPMNQILIEQLVMLRVHILPHRLPLGSDTGSDVRFLHETWWERVNTRQIQNQLKLLLTHHIGIDDLAQIILTFISKSDLVQDHAFVFNPPT